MKSLVFNHEFSLDEVKKYEKNLTDRLSEYQQWLPLAEEKIRQYRDTMNGATGRWDEYVLEILEAMQQELTVTYQTHVHLHGAMPQVIHPTEGFEAIRNAHLWVAKLRALIPITASLPLERL
jgi:hypothetical protein